MKAVTTFERLMPTTADGHIIKITTCYSSFDEAEIDKLQEDLRNEIGSGIMSFEIKTFDDMRGDNNV